MAAPGRGQVGWGRGEPLPQKGSAAPAEGDGKEGSWVHGQVWRGDPADWIALPSTSPGKMAKFTCVL